MNIGETGQERKGYPPVFISYAKVDIQRAREVFKCLTRGGVACWMDEFSLRGGDSWSQEIKRVIHSCKIFIACLSLRSVSHRGFFQTELKTAYEVWKMIPPNKPYLIPLRFDKCEMPDEMEAIHRIDFFARGGRVTLLRDVLHHLDSELLSFRLSEAIEQIRVGKLDEATHNLEMLKNLVSDDTPDFRLRIFYDLACVKSLAAGRFDVNSSQRKYLLDDAFKYLKIWYDYGQSGAWLRSARTANNEVYRMGSDADLLCLLKSHRTEIKIMLGGLATKLPKRLPKEVPTISGSRGGCLLLSEAIESPEGLLAMENVRAGTKVISCMLDNNATPIETLVNDTRTSRQHECVIINSGIMVTPSQPFFNLDNTLVCAGDLKVGARLRCFNGGEIIIESIEKVRGHFEVKTFTTNHNSHNFVCFDIICCNGKH